MLTLRKLKNKFSYLLRNSFPNLPIYVHIMRDCNAASNCCYIMHSMSKLALVLQRYFWSPFDACFGDSKFPGSRALKGVRNTPMAGYG